MNPFDAQQQRFDHDWRELMGLHPLDHPLFAGVSRVWRVTLHPSFHDDLAITVTDIDAGGWLELRVLPSAARTWAMASAGYAVAAPFGPPPKPALFETTLNADALERFAASMPPRPLPAWFQAGRDGVNVDHESLANGTIERAWSWSPSPQRAPAHYHFVRAMCVLALERFTDPAAQHAVRAIETYLR